MKTGMQCTGVYQIGHTQLPNTPQPLEVGVLYQIEKQFRRNGDEPVDGVVEDFTFVQGGGVFTKIAKQVRSNNFIEWILLPVLQRIVSFAIQTRQELGL